MYLFHWCLRVVSFSRGVAFVSSNEAIERDGRVRITRCAMEFFATFLSLCHVATEPADVGVFDVLFYGRVDPSR